MMRTLAVSAKDFVANVIPALSQREAENNLPFGIAMRLAAGQLDSAGAVLLSVESGTTIVAGAVWTPPRDIVVTRLSAPAARVIADHFMTSPVPIGGAAGPDSSGRELAELIAQSRGQHVELRMRQRVYELTALTPVPEPSGEARLASLEEQSFVAQCYDEFVAETGIVSASDSRSWAEAEIKAGSAYLWDHAGPRALACISRETPSGRCVGPVYTPPPFRRRGYATSLVAEIARQILKSGKRFACLFTDDANPTPNHIYQMIGFHEVCRFDSYKIEARH